jgi:AcrR family transcriptional regulator
LSDSRINKTDTNSPRKAQAERRRDSMSLILDCAEARFAENGFNGVTLNEVAAEAGIATSLMRYYFGDKRELFRAVFLRRGPEINARRLEERARYLARAEGELELEPLIKCFTGPAFEKMAQDQGWRNYMAIVAYVNSSRGFLHALMAETFDEVSLVFIADLRTIFPEAREEELYWGYHFMTGQYTFSLGRTGRIDGLSKGLVKSDDVLAIADLLPLSAAAGIRAICTRNAETSGRSPR